MKSKFRFGRGRSLVAASIVAATGGALLLSAPSVGAATVPGAIKSVTISPTNPKPTDKLTTTVNFCVPDGTAAGSTFTLSLPPQLGNLPGSFPVNDTETPPVTVANVTISNTQPAVMTFTMTDYATTHHNTCGTANVMSGYNTSAAPPGQTTPFTSTDGDGKTYTTDITPQPGPVFTGDVPIKYGEFTSTDQGHTDATDAIKWNVQSPVGAFTSATVSDTVAAGMIPDCATQSFVIGTLDAAGNFNFNAASAYTPASKSCSGQAIGATYANVPAGQIVVMTFDVNLSAPTGSGIHSFTNAANLSVTRAGIGTTTYNPSGSIEQSDGSGNGSGDNLTITKWSTADGETAGAFDTAPGKQVKAGDAIPITMTITNGNVNALTNVNVSDATTSGPALTGLTCNFTEAGATSATTTATHWDGPFPSKSTFHCTGTIPALAAGVNEFDTATVTGTGNGQVTSSNEFHSYAPPSVSVGDYVWVDANHDGLQDKTEAGIPGVVLQLTGPNGPVKDVNGNAVGEVTTDANGKYLFPNLPVLAAGQHYTVTIDQDKSADALDGYAPTLAGAGSDRSVDSSTDTADSTALTTNGAQDLTLDFGFYTPTPAVTIVKGDSNGNAADTTGTAVTLANGSTGLVYTITNNGEEDLTAIEVSDTVVANGTVSALSCTFPDATTGTTWDGPFAVGASFTCTAQLSGVTPGSVHEDMGNVTAIGAVSGTSTEAHNPYYAQVPPAGIDTGRAGNGTGPSVMGVVGGGAAALLGLGLLALLIVTARRRTDELS